MGREEEVLAEQEKSISGGHVTRTSTSGLFIYSFFILGWGCGCFFSTGNQLGPKKKSGNLH